MSAPIPFAAPLTALALLASALPAMAAPDYTPTYGAPQAQVTSTVHKGPYFEGDVLTRLPEIKPVPAETLHHVKLDLAHKLVEIDDGVKFEGWTFGDSIPGPTLHVRQGDRIDFEMSNRSNETTGVTFPMPHSIDFHAAMLNPMDKYRTIYPGETIHFQWTANYPGVFMYHCGTPMLLHHMCMGMYGAVVVDPIGGYPDKVDREYVIVQSEFYAKPKDKKHPKILTADIPSALKRDPAYVTFNGRVAELAKHPLKAKAGERVRLYVLNVGPCNTSSFHVVGTLFDKVYLDGNPANLMRGMQTVLLGSSSGAVVELTIPEPGRYPFVDHQFADASKGAIGYIDATDGATGSASDE